MKKSKNNKKIRVLILAEAANPEWTSVPLIGWSLSHAISNITDAHIVTQIRNAEALSRKGLIAGKDFTAIDTEKVLKPALKVAKFLRGGNSLGWTIQTAFQSLAYGHFEKQVWSHFKEALKAGEYDVVHRVTPVSPTAPSPLARKLKNIGIPFIVGPLNGGVPWPKQYKHFQRQERELLSKLRGLSKLLPGHKALMKDSTAILAGSSFTLSSLPNYTHKKSFFLPENAIDTQRFNSTSHSQFSQPLKAVFIGRLVPYKGASIGIKALAPLIKQGLVEYHILGAGPEKAHLKQLCKQDDLNDGVVFHGFVEHAVLQKKLKEMDLLVFPSIREFGGGVILESKALGIVPIIVDYAGPADLLSDDMGFKLPMTDESTLIIKLRECVQQCIDAPEKLKAMRERCINSIASKHTWNKRAEQILHVYRWALDPTSNTPPKNLLETKSPQQPPEN